MTSHAITRRSLISGAGATVLATQAAADPAAKDISTSLTMPVPPSWHWDVGTCTDMATLETRYRRAAEGDMATALNSVVKVLHDRRRQTDQLMASLSDTAARQNYVVACTLDWLMQLWQLDFAPSPAGRSARQFLFWSSCGIVADGTGGPTSAGRSAILQQVRVSGALGDSAVEFWLIERRGGLLILANSGPVPLIRSLHGIAFQAVAAAARTLTTLGDLRRSDPELKQTTDRTKADLTTIADALPRLDCGCAMWLNSESEFRRLAQANLAAQSFLPKLLIEYAKNQGCQS